MRVIISPAKKMNVDTDSFACHGLPQLLWKTEKLRDRLREMAYEELKALWRCNDQLAQLNFERLRDMDLRRRLTPAVMAYEGIQYRYMAPGVFPGSSWTMWRSTCVSCLAFTASCGPLTA